MYHMKSMVKWIQIRLSIVSMTVVWLVLILFPLSVRQFGLIFSTLRNNFRLVPRFIAALLACRREENISWGILLLGTPIIAMIVLLDEYE